MKIASIVTSAALALAAGAAHADIVARWNFNGPSATTVPGGANAPAVASGAGTASLIGGVTGEATFASGTVNGGSTDPVTTTPSNYGWQTTSYPAVSAGNETAGIQFLVSTLGY